MTKIISKKTLNNINFNFPFDDQDREAEYDTLIISCLNIMFDAPNG